MSQSNDYIIITETPDPYDESEVSTKNELVEQNEGGNSMRTLEQQGVAIINEKINVPSSEMGEEPLSQFSQELMNEGGIEIVPNEEEDSFL